MNPQKLISLYFLEISKNKNRKIKFPQNLIPFGKYTEFSLWKRR